RERPARQADQRRLSVRHLRRTPRLLDLMDKHAIKLGVLMIGQVVDKDPDLAKGGRPPWPRGGGHGRDWSKRAWTSRSLCRSRAATSSSFPDATTEVTNAVEGS